MNLTRHLTEVWTAVAELLTGLDSHEWKSPTPCEGWTVHDVAAHLGHVEGLALGFDQPGPPEDFDPDAFSGIDAMTETGVAARRGWTDAEVLDEVRRAIAGTLDMVTPLDEDGWQRPFPSPIGMLPMHQTQDLRLADAYVHLLDMRHGLGRPIDPATEPLTAATAAARAVRLTGWGAVKGARLEGGTRIRLDLTGPGATTADLVVEERRGSLTEPRPETVDHISGSGLAYLLAVAGRPGMAEAAGGLTVVGDAAGRLLEGYRLFL